MKLGPSSEVAIDVVAHSDLAADDLNCLRRLFDAEYQRDFGDWDPDSPYGYAPHDFHVLARQGGRVVGHVGWARRDIRVGKREIVIAGVGGVLISDIARGEGLGARLMNRAAESMTDAGGIEFGYLGCREEVVPFYSACGWTRISAAEHSISREGFSVLDPPGQPLLVLPVGLQLAEWPDGAVELRGRAW